MYSAPDWETISHILTFSSSVRRHVSMMTFSSFPPQLAFTALISESSSSHFLSFTQPMLMTMSISSAPFFTASSVSKHFTAVVA